MDIEPKKFASWAVVELLGHSTVAGYVQTMNFDGVPLIHVRVPPTLNNQSGSEHLFGHGAIYGITPTTEEAATGVASRYRYAPSASWAMIPPATDAQPDDDDLETF